VHSWRFVADAIDEVESDGRGIGTGGQERNAVARAASLLAGRECFPRPRAVFIAFTVELELQPYEGRLPEELQEAVGLVRGADEACILVVGDHDDAFFSLTGDELRPFGASPAKEFAEASLGGLDLPCGCRAREGGGLGNPRRGGAFLTGFGQEASSNSSDWTTRIPFNIVPAQQLTLQVL